MVFVFSYHLIHRHLIQFFLKLITVNWNVYLYGECLVQFNTIWLFQTFSLCLGLIDEFYDYATLLSLQKSLWLLQRGRQRARRIHLLPRRQSRKAKVRMNTLNTISNQTWTFYYDDHKGLNTDVWCHLYYSESVWIDKYNECFHTEMKLNANWLFFTRILSICWKLKLQQRLWWNQRIPEEILYQEQPWGRRCPVRWIQVSNQFSTITF